MPVDPVCGLAVPDTEITASQKYKDKQFYFCSEECKEEFNMDPEMYSAVDEIPFQEEEIF